MINTDKLDWWPSPIAHIPREEPWAAEYVMAAEIDSPGDSPRVGSRKMISVLIPDAEVKEAERNLAGFHHEVSTSGPRPSPGPGRPYTPRFWVGAEGLPRKEYEPLVLSWGSHDKTVLIPEPGFLMTYGLIQRNRGDGGVAWDDRTKPTSDVVVVTPPSTWDFPKATPASVRILKSYLQDYLTLREMALVNVYYEMRYGPADERITEALGKEESVEIRKPDRLIQLNRQLDDRDIAIVQVWGARVVARPGPLPITENSLEQEGLKWPGFKDPVTTRTAERMDMRDVVYVDDRVLAEFEGRPDYQVSPESGSVGFGTQWSVGYCNRAGRSLIRLELKKLYEGAPPHIIRHWNKFAVELLPQAALQQAFNERNIGVRAKEIVYGLAALGNALSAMADAAGRPAKAEEIVGVRSQALDYYGWWKFQITMPIAWHAPLDMTASTFLSRAIALDKLVVEGLSEKALRSIVVSLKVPEGEVIKFRSLKLLDLLVRMAQVANRTGLNLFKDSAEILDRLRKDGTDPAQPLTPLFVLAEIRLLEAHRAADRERELLENLARIGAKAGDQLPGYGRLMDLLYDELGSVLKSSAEKLKHTARR